jgi:hypothetical protein
MTGRIQMICSSPLLSSWSTPHITYCLACSGEIGPLRRFFWPLYTADGPRRIGRANAGLPITNHGHPAPRTAAGNMNPIKKISA